MTKTCLTCGNKMSGRIDKAKLILVVPPIAENDARRRWEVCICGDSGSGRSVPGVSARVSVQLAPSASSTLAHLGLTH